MHHDRRSFIGAAAALALAPRLASAQAGAAQPLRIVVPFAAGSGADIAARVFGDAITKLTSRPVVVDNRGGGGGVIGAQEVARSRPDGNTVLYTTGGITTNAVLIKKLPYDLTADFTPIARVSRSSGFALLVGPKSPHKTMADFIAAAKKAPGSMTYGSSGIGNTTHVMGALFCKGVGIDMLHVPYKATPFTDLVAGNLDAAFISPTIAYQQIRSGQLRALGVSGRGRSPLLPDTATFTEQGLQVQDIPAWTGVWAPANLPPALVQSLYDTIVRLNAQPGYLKYVQESGSEVDALPPAEFKAYVQAEVDRYRRILPALGIEMDA